MLEVPEDAKLASIMEQAILKEFDFCVDVGLRLIDAVEAKTYGLTVADDTPDDKLRWVVTNDDDDAIRLNIFMWEDVMVFIDYFSNGYMQALNMCRQD